MFKFLKEREIEIKFIHAHSLFDAGIWAYRYFKKYGTPYIITEHNQLTFRDIDQEKSNTAVNALNNAQKNLVVSNDKIRQFAANGLLYDFINVGNLISSNFKAIDKKKVSNEIRLITIGAYSPIKDQNTLLKALKIIDNNNIHNIKFTWIGIDGWGGNNERQVRELIDQYDYKNIHTILKPKLNRMEVAKELNESDLFIFSSISEGMPVSVLESLGCGIPVFTSNCGGVDEVIIDTNGRIFPIRNYKRLADLIIQFINKEIYFDKMQISRDAIGKYGEVAFKEKILSIYHSIQ